MQVIRAALLDGGLEASQWCGTEMHGTGTALGDPIEIGAAMAVAAAAGPGATGARISFTAAKSRGGHAETAAGAVGIMHAVHSLGSSAKATILHLAAFNHHVSSILAAACREESLAACIPRQARVHMATR